jgi:hypothetical protein
VSNHLIHVGLPKAGSTALQAWFEVHPHFAHAHDALAGFYRVSELAARAAGPDDPPLWHVTSGEVLSVPRIRDSLPLRGEARPRAVTLTESRERACRMLRSLYGDATVLLVTRGFRSRILSAYSQYVKSGGHGTAPHLRPELPVITEELDYDAVVALYESVFGADRLIVLPYELLRDDASAFGAALEERLGLEPSGVSMPVRNAGLSPAGLVWQRRLNVVVRAVARALPARVGVPLFARWGRLGMADRLHPLLHLLERVVPGTRDGRVHLAPEVQEALRGRAY